MLDWSRRACIFSARLIEKTSQVVAYAAGGVTLVVTFTTIADIVARAMRHPLPGFDNFEFSAYSVIFIAVLGSAAAMRTGDHIRVTSAVSRLSEGKQSKLMVPTFILALFYTVLLVVFSFMLARDSFVLDAKSYGVMQVPLVYPQSILFLGLCLLGAQTLILAVRAIRNVLQRKKNS